MDRYTFCLLCLISPHIIALFLFTFNYKSFIDNINIESIFDRAIEILFNMGGHPLP
ncbi:hypothetical protein HMP0721_2206 [Pseudoramibacter alactolyticus ATCC 23263]|uniref:Uncharacterized protein n=1 Tax=Pseudoramibacter alactolyticus ATCC 23263 TaxID=887929 RepID=E6MJM1_9FIRM|nr:hypothetical protein HMP0721_2206 [Pseudoramibacter alactolyticus ATCC 23263]